LGGSHAFGTDLYDRSIILYPKHRAYYRSDRLVIKIGPKGDLGSYEIRPIHSAPSLGLGQSISTRVLFIKYLIQHPEVTLFLSSSFHLYPVRS